MKRIIIFLIFLSAPMIWAYDINIKDKGDIVSSIACNEDSIVSLLKKTKNGIIASSVHSPDGEINYNSENIFDGNSSTCWCPKGNGINEFIIFKIPYGSKGIKIQNGLAASNNLFKKNNRIKELYMGMILNLKQHISGDLCGERKYCNFNLTYPSPLVNLQDNALFQEIFFYQTLDYKSSVHRIFSNEEFWNLDFFKNASEVYLIIGIISVYQGTKYNDTCISEIQIIR